MKRGEASITHGHKRVGCRTRVYVAWVNMKSRCDNRNRLDFANYGGRGITYDPAWREFTRFYSDMGNPPNGMTLDRADNSLGYSKENCRWVSRAQQNLNKRNCVRYEMNGKNLTLAEWSRETNIGRTALLKRIQRGIPVVVALSYHGNMKSLANDATNALIRIS